MELKEKEHLEQADGPSDDDLEGPRAEAGSSPPPQ